MSRLFLEMTGPPGVGKTTLVEATLPRLPGRYLQRADLKEPKNIAGDERLFDLLRAKLSEASKMPITPSEKLKQTRYWARKLLLDMAAQSADADIFLDEGIIQSFSAAVLRLSDADLKAVIGARVTIFVLARHPATIADRIALRHEHGGKLHATHRRLDRNQLIRECSNMGDQFRRLYARCHNIGCPALLVETEDGIDANADRIVEMASRLTATQTVAGVK